MPDREKARCFTGRKEVLLLKSVAIQKGLRETLLLKANLAVAAGLGNIPWVTKRYLYGISQH